MMVPAQPGGQCGWADWGSGNRDEVREIREGLELADSVGHYNNFGFIIIEMKNYCMV